MKKLNPEQAFRRLKPVLDRGVEIFIAVNPSHAYRWSINNNAYTIASAMKKLEDSIRTERDREMVDWLKIVIPVGVLAFMLAMAFYIVVMATHNGTNVASVVSHVVPHVTKTPHAVKNPGKLKI